MLDSNGPIVATRDAVEASYEQWAAATGACPLADLTRGVKQAYGAFGVAVDASVRVPKQELEKYLEGVLGARQSLAGSTAVAAGGDDDGLANARREKTPTTPSTRRMNPSSTGSLDASAFSFDALPLGENLKYHVALSLKAGSAGTFNPYSFAHPADYVLDAKLQSFETFHATTVVVKKAKPTEEQPRANSEGDAIKTTSSDVITTAHPEISASPGVDDFSSPAPLADVVDQRVTISTTVPPTKIPRSAKAYVLMTLFVVAPPRRFHAAYEWFYQRIRAHENENERVALANVFAASTAIGFMKFFDHLVRMVTGHPAEFVATRTATSMMRLPSDMSRTMMVKRKYVGMYLSKDGEWTLSEVTNSGEIYDYEVPGGPTETE